MHIYCPTFLILNVVHNAKKIDMLKKILLIVGIIIAIVIIIGAIGINYFKPDANLVLNFIKENPNKTAIKLVRNDSLITERNPNKLMPLASTVKIILAIEYALQSSQGKINPHEEISIDELAKFYIPNTDGGAHPSWLKSVKNKISDNQIPINEIAKGMIRYSSNANTEWLGNRLGIKNINNRIDSLGVENHTEFYNIVSALFVGKEKFPKSKGKELERKLKNLSIEDYIETTNRIHKKLITDSIYKKNIGDLGMNIQRIWSDNLPSSTVKDYFGIMKKINSKTYFDTDAQKYLDEVMEGLMENPANRKWLKHAGKKGGSTAFVLTEAFYATDKKGNTTELAYFFNDLGTIENTRLQGSMNEFELKILTDKKFRDKIKTELKN